MTLYLNDYFSSGSMPGAGLIFNIFARIIAGHQLVSLLLLHSTPHLCLFPSQQQGVPVKKSDPATPLIRAQHPIWGENLRLPVGLQSPKCFRILYSFLPVTYSPPVNWPLCHSSGRPGLLPPRGFCTCYSFYLGCSSTGWLLGSLLPPLLECHLLREISLTPW